jgi:hypothetical protein
VRSNLVEEDRRAVAQDDVSVVRMREVGVDQLEAPELRARHGLALDVLFAELGGVAVGYDREVAEVLEVDVC